MRWPIDTESAARPTSWHWVTCITLILDFKVIWKTVSSGLDCLGTYGIRSWTHFVTMNFDLTKHLDLRYSVPDFEKAVHRGWECGLWWNKSDVSQYDAVHSIWPDPRLSRSNCEIGISQVWMACESIDCWTHHVTLNFEFIHDYKPGFSRTNFQMTISRI